MTAASFNTSIRRTLLSLLFLAYNAIAPPIYAVPVTVHTSYAEEEAIIDFSWQSKVSVITEINDDECLLRGDQGLEFPDLSAFTDPQIGPWIQSLDYGYDTFLINIRPDVTASFTEQTNGTSLHLTLPPSAQKKGSESLQHLALLLAETRLHLEDHNTNKSIKLLQKAQQDHPQHLSVLLACTQTEVQMGRPIRAFSLLNEAQHLAPRQSEVVTLQEELAWTYSPDATIQGELRHAKGESMEQRYRISARTLLLCQGCLQRVLKLSLYQNNVKVKTLPDTNGTSRGFAVDRAFGDLQLTQRHCCGLEWTATAHLGDFSPGVGASFALTHPYCRGEITALVEVLRPNWDFIGSIVHRGTRSGPRLIALYHCNSDLVLSGSTAIHHYRVQHWGEAATTAALRANATYSLCRPIPTFRVAYSLDAEYGLHERERLDQNGNLFTPLLFSSREVHSVILLLSASDLPCKFLEVFAGYSYNRYGGHGPNTGVRGFFRWNRCWELSGELQHTLNTTSTVTEKTENTLNRILLSLRKRF